MTDLTRYALAAAGRGWPVFPLTPGGKCPPRGLTGWERRATTDPATIRAWWAEAPYNIGIATGPARLLVLDLDKPKKDGLRPTPFDLPGVADGEDVLALVCDRAGETHPTWETFQVRTRRGGLHLYYTAPDGATLGNTSGQLGWLIDTRGTGGYVVGPGSRVALPDGTGTYQVIYNAPPAPLPPLLFQLLTPDPRPIPPPVTLTLPAGRTGAYLRAALDREATRIATAPPGQRNRALYVAAVALGQLVAGGQLTEHQVRAVLEQQGGAVGQTPAQISYTIAAGLKAGARRPRAVALVL